MHMFDITQARDFLTSRGKNHIVGWSMTPEEAHQFFSSQGKTVLTFLGYSMDYEDEPGMLKTAQAILEKYSPETNLVNIGATEGGMGSLYPLAKSLGFTTTGIVSTQTLPHPEWISKDVDYVCFIADDCWGGKLTTGELAPTSQAMVMCSDVFIGIGGGPISRDEMLEGQALGKPVFFYPAEMNHQSAIRWAKRQGLPTPTSFWGEAHQVFSQKPSPKIDYPSSSLPV